MSRLFGFAAPYRVNLSLGLALMLLESLTALAVPWLGGRLADGLLRPDGDGGAVSMLAATLWMLLAVFALQALIKFANSLILGNAWERFVADLKIRLYDHLQALPVAFFQERRHGDMLALFTRDVYSVGDYVSGTALSIPALLVAAGGSVVMMLRIDARLALLAAALVPLFFLVVKIVGRRIRPLAQQLQEEEIAAIAIADENLGMLPAIKTFTREREASDRYRQQVERIVTTSARQRVARSALGPVMQLVAAAGIVLVLWLASGPVGHGGLEPGELVSFLLYGQLLARPVAGLADVYGQTQNARVALARLVAAMDEPAEAPPHIGVALPPIKGDIEFCDVSFAYLGRPRALDRVNLSIRAGETVVLIGPNGAGKSTLAHLLMRLHEPISGQILIDSIDIGTATLPSLRSQVGIVPQHVLLFNATVRDNIAYGRVTPTPGEIERAARAVSAHEFIMQLPQGYDTVIGDRGVRLSGGQQQRLALARAILKDPPILILDEATAMFDPQGEMEFLEACSEVLKNRTVLLITHRPASLAVASRIVRMENGRVLTDVG